MRHNWKWIKRLFRRQRSKLENRWKHFYRHQQYRQAIGCFCLDHLEPRVLLSGDALSGVINLSQITNQTLNGAVIQGAAEGDYAGRSIASAGDVNGDGYDDILIGAPNADHNGSYSGNAYLLYGSASSLPTQVILPDIADGFVEGTIFRGSETGDSMGLWVDSAGDVQGGDILPIVGTPLATGQIDTTIDLNFQGAYYGDGNNFYYPADTMGAVGLDHVVVMVNGLYSVYDKGSGSRIQSSSLNQFWLDAGVSYTGFTFDPRVVYDAHEDRWYATSVDNKNAGNNIFVAVSNTGDPTDGWTAYKFDSDDNNSHWADFPMLGYNGDYVVVSANMFALGAGSTTVSFLVLDKTDLLNLEDAPTYAYHSELSTSQTGFTPQPVVDMDNGHGALQLLSAYNKPSGYLRISSVDLTGVTVGDFVDVTARRTQGDIDQPGDYLDIDAGDTRFSSNVVYNNGSFWAVHGVDVNWGPALEWYQIDAQTAEVFDSGIIADYDMSYNYPSIAVNEAGDVIIGFSGGSPSTYMSSYYVEGSQDADGHMVFSDPQLITSGTDEYQITDTSNRNRWGDYSATVLDPSNPGTFWTFQEYVKDKNVWAVGVTKINIDSGIVGDYVWHDADQDGVQDDGEEGLANVQVRLFTSTGTLLDETTTDSLGHYLFSRLADGDYYIEFILPEGYQYSPRYVGSSQSDSDAVTGTGRSGVFTVSSGTSVQSIDAGMYRANASIGNYVWDDVNQNGIQDVNESGLPGMTVNLLNSSGTFLVTTTTDQDGAYRFENLDPGSYIVEFVTSGDYQFSQSNVGSDDALDSDADTATGRTSVIWVVAGDTLGNVDAGMFLPVTTISGVIWSDLNHNAMQNVGEHGLQYFHVKLLDADGFEMDGILTDVNGYYIFEGVEPGNYIIEVEMFSSYQLTSSDIGSDALDSDIDPDTGRTSVFSIAGNEQLDFDAGVNAYPVITSTQHASNTFEGIPLYVSAAFQDAVDGGVFDSGIHTATIDWGDGSSTNLMLGSHLQTIGESHTYANDGIYDVTFTLTDQLGQSDQATMSVKVFNVLPTVHTGGDYVIYQGTSLELDASGTTDPGSDTLSYEWDLDNDGQYDDAAGISTTVSWATLAALGYTADSIAHPIAVRVSDDDGFKIGSTTLTINPPVAESSISGVAWEDRNANNVRDDGDMVLVNVPVELYDDLSNLLQTTTTDENGAYSFTELIAGSYQVKFIKSYEPYRFFVTRDANSNGEDDRDSDADMTTGFTQVIELDAFESVEQMDVGYMPTGRISMSVWLDANANGIFDAGEGALAGTVLALDRVDGNYHNYWTFNTTSIGAINLAPGAYVVTATLPDGYSMTDANQGADDSVDSDIDPGTLTFTLTLGQDQTHATVGAGVLANGQIGDHLWLDQNENGIKDDGENGIAGQTVNLLNSDGSVYLTTTTDANGDYLFDHVIASDYSVEFIAPLGYEFTLQNVGSDVQIDSDVDPQTGRTSQFTLTANQQITDIDAGLHITSAQAEITITPQSVAEGSSIELAGTFNHLITAGQSHMVIIDWGDGAGVLLDFEAGVLNFTQSHTYTNDGSKQITLQITDAQNHVDQQDFQVVVTNVLPTVQIGDPYVIDEGSGLTLDASGTTDPGSETLIFAWDLDHDGAYDDATGVSPTLTWSELTALDLSSVGIAQTIGLRVTDDHGSVTQSTTLTINNVLPNVSVGGSYIVYDGYELILDASATTDAGGDTLTYEWDLDNDGVYDDATGVSPTISWDTLSSLNITSQGVDYSIAVRVSDDDGFKIGSTTFSVLPVPADSSISGIAWVDRDQNLWRTNGDTTLSGVEVELYDEQENLLLTTLTDANGAYTFSGLLPGQYAVKFQVLLENFHFILPQGIYDDELDNDASSAGWTERYDVGLLDQVANVDVGYSPNGIMRFWVWLDENANNTYEIGEKDAAGIVEIVISGIDSSYYRKDKIYPNNKYKIVTMNSGEYQVHLLLDEGYELAQPHQGDNPNYDSDIDPATLTSNFTVVEGQFDPYIGIGLLGIGQIGDRVWLDQNANGIEDAGESGVAGVTVNLLYENGQSCQSTVTDANGDYLFDHVIQGNYIIAFQTPDGGYLTTQDTGADDTIDSDADPLTGRTSVLSLTQSGQTHHVNAGLIATPVLDEVTTPASIAEGVRFDLEGLLSHLDHANQSHFVEIQWGDGQTDTFNLAAGELLFERAHTYANDGTYNFSVSATDSRGEQDQYTGLLTVGNVLPTVDMGSVYVIYEGSSLTLDASGTTDPGDDALTYAWDLDNDGVYDDATRVGPTLTWLQLTALGLSSDGIAQTIGLRVTDDHGSVTQTTTLTINNVLPDADAGDAYVIDEGSGLTLDASGTTDPGNDTMAYAWDLDNDGVYDDATGIGPTLTWSELTALGLSSDGTAHPIRVRVTDDQGVSTAASTLTINNHLPMGNAGGPYHVDEGSGLTLDATGTTDVGDDPLSYAWDLDGDGEFDDALGATPTITWGMLVDLGLPSDGSVLPISLHVSDDTGSVTTFTTLTINNLAPVVQVGGPYAIDEGQSVILDAFAATDPGNDILTYAWDLDHDGEFDDAFGSDPTISWDTLESLGLIDGDYTIALEVDDTQGGKHVSTTTLSVQRLATVHIHVWEDTNGNGTWDADESTLVEATVNLLDEQSHVVATAQTDSDGIVSFNRLYFGAYQLQIIKQPGWQFAQANVGEDETRDSDLDPVAGLSDWIALDEEHFDATLTAGLFNPPPMADAGDGYELVAGDALTLDASGSTDQGEDQLTYAWDLDDDGEFDDAFGINPQIDWATLYDLHMTDGACIIGMQVTDLNGNTDTAYTTLMVNQPDLLGQIKYADIVNHHFNTQLISLVDDATYVGSTLMAAGDINGDGLEDWLVAVPSDQNTSNNVYLIYGTDDMSADTIQLSDVINGQYANAIFMGATQTPDQYIAVAPAGDVNGDGYSDLYIILFTSDDTPSQTYLLDGQAASISGYVWDDVDYDGYQDDSESAMDQVTVHLLDESGNMLRTTLTDENGQYRFDGLWTGDYAVRYELPRWYRFTLQHETIAADRDSDVDLQTGQTDVITIASAHQNAVLDAGMLDPNHAPQAAPNLVSTDYQTAIDIDVLSNDFDADGDALVVSQLLSETSKLGVTLTINADSTIHYDPSDLFETLEPGQKVRDIFRYQITDTGGKTDTHIVFVDVYRPLFSENHDPVDHGGEQGVITTFSTSPRIFANTNGITLVASVLSSSRVDHAAMACLSQQARMSVVSQSSLLPTVQRTWLNGLLGDDEKDSFRWSLKEQAVEENM